MIVVEASAEAYVLRCAGLEFSFRFVGDRWHHFVSAVQNGSSLPLFASSEGTATDVVLPSPAFQDLRFEELREGVFEFQLLGQAGKGVYSAAVRFDGQERSITFDVCARGRSNDMPLCIASRYFLAEGIATPIVQPGQNGLIIRKNEARPIEIVPTVIPGHPGTECRLIGDESSRQILAGFSDSLRLEPTPKGMSVRWAYLIRAVPGQLDRGESDP